MCCIPHKSTVLNLVYFACCVSHELQGIFFFKYYTSTNTICLPHVNWLVHDVHACLVLKERQTLALGVVGGVSRLMANPAKNPSTYLSPTNIPMMTNYPSYTATWHTSTTSRNQYRCVGGRGTGVLLLCCGAAWVFRSQRSQYSPLCLKQRRVSQEPDAIQREVYYPG